MSVLTAEGLELVTDRSIVLKAEELEKTYNGGLGCACGCGGTYTEAGEVSATSIRRLNLINKAIANGEQVGFLDAGDRHIYELVNPLGTRVTRVYVRAFKSF
jgi:hypothetical protein